MQAFLGQPSFPAGSIYIFFDPIALRKAKIVCNFGISGCSGVNLSMCMLFGYFQKHYLSLNSDNASPFQIILKAEFTFQRTLTVNEATGYQLHHFLLESTQETTCDIPVISNSLTAWISGMTD